MKKKLTRKQWFGAILLLLFFILFTIFLYSQLHEDKRFEAFCENFFREELCANPIHLHYTLTDTSAYDIEESALTLPVYHSGQALLETDNIDQNLALLSTFHPEKLSNENQYAYILLASYLKTARNCASYPYFKEPLSPSSGVQSELPILLAEYRIAAVQDIENYLSILTQIPSYLEGIALYEREKADYGLFMSDAAADKVIEQCSTLMNPAQLSSGEHFLLITFKNRLDSLVEQQLINETEALAWQAENDRLLTTVVAPAYDKLADELTLLKGSGSNTQGLCHFPNGQEYYEAYLSVITGSSRNIGEIKTMLSEDFSRNYSALIQLFSENTDLQNMMSAGSDSAPSVADLLEDSALTNASPEEMLHCLKSTITKNYPAIPDTTTDAIECTIKYVDSSLENYTAPAFYLLPPIDNTRQNTIYINRRSTPEGLPLFTTLAHEGYPGHLYQTVYSRQYLQAKQANPIRNILHYGGYVEGWALYVELSSYEIAGQLADNSTIQTLYQAEKLDRQIQLCLYSLLDIIIHYEGASYERVAQLLSSIGFSEQAALAIYHYIVEEPGNYLKYYLGYLEILALKNHAETAWGNSFTLYRFHTFFLNNGPADFQTLSSILHIDAAANQPSFKLDKKN